MKFGNVVQHLKTILLSTTIMLLVVYGMATGNTWIQYGGIVLVFVGQMVYQLLKSIRSAPLLNANTAEAVKVKNGKLLLKMTADEIMKIKRDVRDTGDIGLSSKMLLVMFIPLGIFFATSYILGMIDPNILPWQSYLIGFLASLPVSTIITIKMGVSQPTSAVVSPNNYYIGEKGIVFDYMNNSFILKFPMTKMTTKKEKKFIEVEGQPTKSAMIPHKLKLFSYDVDQLQRMLNRFVET